MARAITKTQAVTFTIETGNEISHYSLWTISDVMKEARRLSYFRYRLAKALFTLDKEIIQATVIDQMTGHVLSPHHVADIIPHMDDFSIDQWPAEIWTPDPLIWCTRFSWPKKGMENSTYREFLIMDSFLEDILSKNGDMEENMYCLLATIMRPVTNDKAYIIRQGDNRVPLISRDQAKAWAAWLKKSSASVFNNHTITCCMAQALVYAIAMKVFLRKIYGQWLFDKSGTGSPSNDPDFGWSSVAMRVAKTGIFGDIEGVLNTKLHDVMVHLVDSAVEHNRQMRELDKIKKQ